MNVPGCPPTPTALLRGILEEEGWVVVAEAADGVEAVQKYLEFRPDITTMDVVMPKKCGIEATAEITGLDRDAKVVMCTAMGQESLMEEAKQAGAHRAVIHPLQSVPSRELGEKNIPGSFFRIELQVKPDQTILIGNRILIG